MPTELVRYQLDASGVNPDNLVVGEIHTLSNLNIRALSPIYGAFFAESVVVYDHTLNTLLVKGQDYLCVELLQEATLKFGKEIVQLILIKNTNVTNQIRINYQTLGGLYQHNAAALVNVYESFTNDIRDVNWISILNKPNEFPPSLHNHLVSDLYGFEPLVSVLERIRNAITVSDLPTYEALIDWIKTRFGGNLYTINPGSNSINDGDTLIVNVTSSNLANNTTLYWTIRHIDTIDADFTAVSGSVNMVNNAGQFNVTSVVAETLTNDKNFVISLREQNITGSVLIETQILTINANTELTTVNQPSITSPINNSTSQSTTVSVTGSAFSVNNGSDTHEGSDWQIATDVGFTNIVSQVVNSSTNKVSYSHPSLGYATTYYVRTRYKGTTLGYSPWSNIITFQTVASPTIDTPTLSTIIPSNTSINPTINISAFAVTGGSDTHESTDWQIATDVNFTNIVRQSNADTVNKTSWTPSPSLSNSTTYYIRFRHKGLTYGYSSWSAVTTITTSALPIVNQPTITSPVNNSIDQAINVSLTSDAFAVTNGSDSHEGSDWQIATDVGFTNIIEQVINSATNKLSYAHSDLAYNTSFYVRVRYKGASIGYSEWSTAVHFTTEAITINKPTIINPPNNSRVDTSTLNIDLSEFISLSETVIPLQTEIQIHTTSNFVGATSIYKTSGDLSTLDENLIFSEGTTLYIRARYHGSNSSISQWSDTATITTTNTVPLFITEQDFTSSDIALYDKFGISIAMSDDGTRLIAGAHREGTGATDAGSAYIFIRDGNKWVQEAKIQASSPSASAYFGISVAMDNHGSRVIVGASGESIGGAAYVFSRSGTTWTQETRLVSSDLEADDNFGVSVNISGNGDLVICGAPGEDTGGSSVGAAYIFSRVITTWTEESKIQATDKEANDSFGHTVAIAGIGGRAIVGAKYESTGFTSAGSAYIFVRSGTTWSQEAKLQASDKADSDFFGSSVDINENGDVVAIGAYYKNNTTNNEGSVYIFGRVVSSWFESNQIYPSDPVVNANFGQIVKLNSNNSWLIVGAVNSAYVFKNVNGNFIQHYKLIDTAAEASSDYGYSVDINKDGDMYVVGSPFIINSSGIAKFRYYINNNKSYIVTEEQKIQSTITAANDLFGYSIDIDTDGSRIIVGAYGYNSGTLTGAAYIFLRSETTWTQEAKLEASDAIAGDNFGFSVAISGDASRAIVGSFKQDTGGTDIGAAYIFLRTGTTWSQEAKLQSSDKAAGDYFGWSVDITDLGDRVAIGASDKTNVQSTAGKAYIFLRTGTTWSEEAILGASVPATLARFGISISIDGLGTRVIIGASSDNEFYSNGGAAYIFKRSVTTWTQEAKITPNDIEAGGYFGNSVDIDYEGNKIIVGSYGSTTDGITAGAAYIFIRSGTIWSQEAKLYSNDKASNDNFGIAVSMSNLGDIVCIGAMYDSNNGYSNNGSSYIFSSNNSSWTQDSKIISSDAANADHFGSSIAISGDGTKLSSGAYLEDTGGTSAGSAYVFNVKNSIYIEKPIIFLGTTTVTIGRTYDVILTNTFEYKGAVLSHYSTDWQMATDIGFTNIIEEHLNDTTNLYVKNMGVGLIENTNYYIRARYNSAEGFIGNWSDTATVITKTAFVPNIETTKLQATVIENGAQYGRAVSVTDDGTRVAVTAVFEGATDYGAAYIYLYKDFSWHLEAKLVSSDIEDNDYFGTSIAISGDGSTVIIGASGEDTGGINAGAAYIFTRTNNTWSEQAKLQASDKTASSFFGDQVAITYDGNRAVVGAYGSDNIFVGAGEAYVFLRTGSTWAEEQILISLDIEAYDIFGKSVSITNDGTRIIVGASGEDTGASDAGAAYIFLRSGTTWTQEAKIQASDFAIGDAFGCYVDINTAGDRVVVGAFAKDTAGNNAGAAYVFSRSGTTWTEEDILLASDKEAEDNFGLCVSISGDGSVIIVGAYGEDTGGSLAGSSYIFTRSGVIWSEVNKIQPSDVLSGDAFGWHLNISESGNAAIIASEFRSDINPTAGAIYIFK